MFPIQLRINVLKKNNKKGAGILNILHLVPSAKFSGVHSFVLNYYQHIDRKKFHFDLLTRGNELGIPSQFSARDFGIQHLPEKSSPDKDKVVKEILASGYDAFHIHTSFWQGFWLEKKAKEVGIPKIIVHSHSTSIAGIEEETRREELRKRHFILREKLSPEVATDFLACSKEASEWLFGTRIPKKQIHLIKNAIDVELYGYNSDTRIKLRSQLGISDSFVLGTTGGFWNSKNPYFLLEVFREFHHKHLDAKLLYIGEGPKKQEIENHIKELNLEDSILVLGFQENIQDFLQAMDCYLLPSLFEGMPISLIEAASAGLPCLASDRITQEVETVENITRLPLDIPTWIQALDRMIDKPISRPKGVEVVRAAGYDIKKQVKVLEDLYLGKL